MHNLFFFTSFHHRTIIMERTMKRLISLLVISAFSLPLLSAQQKEMPVDRAKLAAEVKADFVLCWNAYKKYAWGHDGLRPLSKSFYDWYKVPLYLTPLDALDTMILMGLREEADSTKAFLLKNLSFDQDIYVKNFEITIRALGGLLSSYQLTGEEKFLLLAQDLGDRLLKAFNSPTGMPYVDVNLRTGATRGKKTNPGEIGTLLVEFGTLSMLTGNPKYYNTAKYALLQLYERRSDIGLVGTWIDCETGEWLDPDSHLSACIDSYYEYLVKCARLFDDKDCLVMWQTHYPALNKYLLDSTATGLWYGHADMKTGKRTKRHFGALDAYFPAVLVLAGDYGRAARLQEACLAMWKRHGIEPETFDYVKMEAVSPRFFLNPEIIESAYYLYQYTRDERYVRMGKIFYDSLKTYCRTESGYAELKSVLTKEKSDRMESYFMAETLKYLYLLFAPRETLDFQSVIFNTEAHPIRRTW
jgi:mannosidase alpha-like ER degradation enhancer 2